MINVVYIAIAVLLVLMGVSVWLTSRNRYFEKQVRDKSELAMRYLIDHKNETDCQKSIDLFYKAEKLQEEIALIIGKHPKMKPYGIDLAPQSENEPPQKELSLGELFRQYDKKNNHAVIYAKFNKNQKDS